MPTPCLICSVELRDREGQTFVVVTHNEGLAARGDRTVSCETA